MTSTSKVPCPYCAEFSLGRYNRNLSNGCYLCTGSPNKVAAEVAALYNLLRSAPDTERMYVIKRMHQFDENFIAPQWRQFVRGIL